MLSTELRLQKLLRNGVSALKQAMMNFKVTVMSVHGSV